MVGKPVTAKAKDDASRTTFAWKCIASQGAMSLPLIFTGTRQKADNGFRVMGLASGGDDVGSGGANGTCTPRK